MCLGECGWRCHVDLGTDHRSCRSVQLLSDLSSGCSHGALPSAARNGPCPGSNHVSGPGCGSRRCIEVLLHDHGPQFAGGGEHPFRYDRYAILGAGPERACWFCGIVVAASGWNRYLRYFTFRVDGVSRRYLVPDRQYTLGDVGVRTSHLHLRGFAHLPRRTAGCVGMHLVQRSRRGCVRGCDTSLLTGHHVRLGRHLDRPFNDHVGPVPGTGHRWLYHPLEHPNWRRHPGHGLRQDEYHLHVAEQPSRIPGRRFHSCRVRYVPGGCAS